VRIGFGCGLDSRIYGIRFKNEFINRIPVTLSSAVVWKFNAGTFKKSPKTECGLDSGAD